MSFNPSSYGSLMNQNVSSGNKGATTLLVSPKSGLYHVYMYVSPAATNALATVTVTIGWTENGVAKAQPLSALSLLSLGNVAQQTVLVLADAGTPITYTVAVTGSAGQYSLIFAVKSL